MLFVGAEDKTDERGRGRKGGRNVVGRREDEDEDVDDFGDDAFNGGYPRRLRIN